MDQKKPSNKKVWLLAFVRAAGWVALYGLLILGIGVILKPIWSVLSDLARLVVLCWAPLVPIVAGRYHRSWRVGVAVLLLELAVALVVYILMLFGRLNATA